MATNSKAIGLLFEVAGAGDINGETGRRINGQLRQIVGQISPIQLKFTIDSNHFKREIEEIKKQLQNLNTDPVTTSGSGAASGINAHSDAYRSAVNAVNEYYKAATQVHQAMTRTNDIVKNADGTFSTSNQRWADLVRYTEEARGKMDMFNQAAARVNMTQEEQASLDARVASEKQKLQVKMSAFEANGQSAWSNLTAKVHDYISRVESAASRSDKAKRMLEGLRNAANSTDWRGYDALKQKLAETQAYINANDLATEKWYQRMLKTFGTRVRSLLAGLVLAKVTQYLRDIYKNVVDIDGALTRLRIVTGASERQMEKFLSNSTRLAKELGASIKDVIASVETFSRLGYGLTDATILSKYATILSKVADVSSEEATKGLTSILKGYGFDPSDSEHIADVLVEVGQKYAVSASELMTAYEKAGAALNATNTSFEKSAGLIAAANASVQDASVVGTALKTVSARIRKSKADLDDLGESADDLAESWSVYAEEIKALTGFNIMVEGSKTQFKDLYDIFSGLAQVWDNLGEDAETTQARVAEILGGSRQFQVISSILSNWDDAAGAYTDALNSAGTSMQAMSIYTDSVQGRVEQLKSTFQEFSEDLLDSSIVKGVTTIVTCVLTLLDSIVKLIDLIGGLNTVLGITAGLVAVIKAETIVTFIHGAIFAIGSFIVSAKAAIVQMFTMVKASKAAQASMTGLATSEQLAAVKTAELRMAMLKLVAVVAVITVVIQAIKALDNAWQDSYQSHLDAAEKYNEEADGYAKEIDSLVSLQKQLQDASGDKKKLASIYDDLNKEISVSTALIDGETGAYLAANQQLQDRIQYLKDLEDQARKTAIAESRSAFNENKAKRYGDILGAIGLTSSSIFMWDWAASDATGDQLRKMMRGQNDKASVNGHVIDYDYWTNQMTESQQDIFLRQQGLTRESWNTYWQGQIDTALKVFADVIKTYDGYLGSDFISNVVRSLVMHGYDLDEIDSAVADLEAADSEVESLINDYYNSLANKDARSSEYYNKIVEKLDEIKKKYPELSEQIDNFIGGISKSITVSGYSDVLKIKSVYSILEQISGKYDAITDAMKDMEEYGVLTSKTFESMIKDYPDLIEYLSQTADGYILNANALELYITNLIDAYTSEATLAAMTSENKEIAISNLRNLQTALNMLAGSYAKVKSDSSARKDALQDEKDTLKEQLDAYKELIDVRKKLLKQYEDELKYKRELEKKERQVASLKSKLAVSQLDNTAAGRARTRQIAKDLEEAQEDLNDFTLEHAIDVVTEELDGQYTEYKSFIDGKLNSIDSAISDLDDSFSSSISTAARSASDKISEAIDKINDTPVIDTPPVTDQTVVVPSYDDALAAAQAYIDSHGFLEGDKARWGQDQNFYSLYKALVAAGGSLDDLHGKTETVKGNTSPSSESTSTTDATSSKSASNVDVAKAYAVVGVANAATGHPIEAAKSYIKSFKALFGIYHSGGVVGDTTNLKSTEEFAKLLKGEFVATPKMMERFMGETLPSMVGVGSSASTNEFNAPLISIQCETVTQESLPKLKEIVDGAVKEIKRQFDSGLSRSGYHKTVNKIV